MRTSKTGAWATSGSTSTAPRARWRSSPRSSATSAFPWVNTSPPTRTATRSMRSSAPRRTSTASSSRSARPSVDDGRRPSPGPAGTSLLILDGTRVVLPVGGRCRLAPAGPPARLAHAEAAYPELRAELERQLLAHQPGVQPLQLLRARRGRDRAAAAEPPHAPRRFAGAGAAFRRRRPRRRPVHVAAPAADRALEPQLLGRPLPARHAHAMRHGGGGFRAGRSATS